MTKTDLTRNQSLVFDALVGSDGPLSAYTLLDRLREHGFRAPLQVYRALDKLVEFGMVHRLESLNAFVACAHASESCCHDHGTVAFAICNSCGPEGGRLTAPMPGKVVSFAVKAGDAVKKGQPLAVMEAMKMEHTIAAPADGTVAELLYAPGDQVAEGAELLKIQTA